jgi:hypothetical protein
MVARSLPCFPSADEENISSLCLIAEIDGCVFIEEELTCSRSSWQEPLFRDGRKRSGRDGSSARLRFLNKCPKRDASARQRKE